jgi:hypothetical protein
LKRVSKVKNHSFQEGSQEYDPASVVVPHRPLASARSPQRDSQMNIAKSQAHEEDTAQLGRPPSPSKDQASPSKSSLSKGSRYGKGFDPQNDIWSEYGSAGHRHAKSVTFDHAPPQVNEYEMTTPDPSSTASESRENSYESEEEGDISFEHESSIERDDSFDASLEDIEKTPVVLPEDWRFMSPGSNADSDPFVDHIEEDSTEERPISREAGSSRHTRVESLDSNGERRPLPPLPSVNRMSAARPSSAGKMASAFELGSAGLRGLPVPPAAASCNKSDITGAVSLEDRLRLMMLQERENDENHDQKHHTEEPLELPMADEDATPTNGVRDDDESHELFFSPPRISRDSILRGIRNGDSFEEDDSFDESSQIASSPHHYDHYDPDVPIPSLETDDDDSSSVIVKQEEREEDLYSITDYYQNKSDNSLSSRDQRAKYDEDSNYSLRSAAEAAEAAEQARAAPEHSGHGSGQTTPVAEEQDDAEKSVEVNKTNAEHEELNDSHDRAFDMSSVRQSLARPVTPEMQEGEASEPSTPDSVIRHPVNDDQNPEEDPEEESFHEEDPEEEETEHYESSSDESVPEPVATIRAPGAGLKTRPSLTPADMQSMAATRRKISGQHIPPVPPLTKQTSNDSNSSDREQKPTDSPPKLAMPTGFAQRQSSLMQLDIPFSIQEESLGSGLNKEFDRVIESQKVAFHIALSQSPHFVPSQTRTHKDPVNQGNRTPADPSLAKQRGYLMRQNTKVIIASSRNEEEPMPPTEQTAQDPRGTRSAGSSPRKPSQQTWTTVPWNGSARRSSIKPASGIPKKKPVPGTGGVPPLPGQASNVQEAPAIIEENEPAISESFEEGEERGRLFVKVVGLKYCDLPLPRGTHTPTHFT